MKKLFLVLVALSLAMFVAAQSNKTEKQKEDKTSEYRKGTSSFAFDSLVIDYGVIQKGSSGETVFRFKNVGKEPIILTDVSAACGCTTPDWTKDPILPKKTGEIRVKYDTNRMGYFNKTISIKSNKNPDTPIVLTIKGEVVNQ
ncbi:MAG: DUF1573 domain-containing protein [Bacteroidales bacterium]|jgi:ABC-type oligopeptide transport system substrate-binding subunit|nr:DUF1573 domain-containing protein [Bacteroidales bacterium]